MTEPEIEIEVADELAALNLVDTLIDPAIDAMATQVVRVTTDWSVATEISEVRHEVAI